MSHGPRVIYQNFFLNSFDTTKEHPYLYCKVHHWVAGCIYRVPDWTVGSMMEGSYGAIACTSSSAALEKNFGLCSAFAFLPDGIGEIYAIIPIDHVESMLLGALLTEYVRHERTGCRTRRGLRVHEPEGSAHNRTAIGDAFKIEHCMCLIWLST